MQIQKRNKFAVFIVVMVATLYVGNILIDNPYSHRFVNFYLNEKLLNQLPVGAEYQSMKVQLFPPSVRLFGFRVWNKNEDGTRSEELISTNQASLSISPWSLFLAKPQIGDLEFHGLKGIWPPPENVMKAITALSEKDPKKSATNLTWPPSGSTPLSTISINDANLIINFPQLSLNVNQDPDEVTSLALSGANVNIDFRSWKDIFIEADVSSVNVYDRGQSYIEDAKVALSGRLRGEEFQSKVFSVTSKRLTSQGDVNVDLRTVRKGIHDVLNSVAISFKQNVDADFSLLGSFIDLGGCLGRVSAHATAVIDIPIATESAPTLIVKGTARSQGASIDDFHLYDSESDFTVNLDGMTFDEIRIKSGAQFYGKAKGKLSFNNKLDYEFFGKPANLPFDMLLGVFNVPFDILNFGLTSENLVLRGQGDPFFMKVTADAKLSDFTTPALAYDHSRIPNPPVCKLDLNMDINTKGINFDGSKGDCGHSFESMSQGFPLIVSGNTFFNEKSGMKLTLDSPQVQSLGPLSYFSQIDLRGQGSFRAIIHGPYNNVAVDYDLRVNQAAIGSTPIEKLDLMGTVNANGVAWSQIAMSTESGGQITSQGSIAFTEDLNLQTEIQATQLDHAMTSSLFQDILGEKSSLEMVVDNLRAKISGPLLSPLQYRGDINFNISSIRDNEYSYASRFQGHLEGSATGYSLKNAKIENGKLKTTADASIIRATRSDSSEKGASKNANFAGITAADKIDINLVAGSEGTADDQLQYLPIIAPLAAKAGIKGVVSGTAKLTGNIHKLSGIAKLKLNHLKIFDSAIPAVQSAIIFDGLKFEFLSDQGGNSLKSRINADFGEKGFPFKWYIAAKNYDMRPFLPSVFSGDPRNFAYLSATWSLDGVFSEWWRSTGEFDIKQISAKLYPLKNTSLAPFEVSSRSSVLVKMTSEGWQIDDRQKLLLHSDFGAVQIGLVESKPPENIGIGIEGKISLEFLKTLYSKVEIATGQLQFSGGLFGSVTDPKLDLMISDTKITAETGSTWQPVSLGTSDFRPPVKDVQLKSRLTTSGIQIDSFSGVKGTGKVSAEGFLALSETAELPTDVSIFLNDASFLYPFPVVKNFDSVLDGNLRLTGTSKPLLAAGRIDVKRARSNRDIDIRTAILESLRSSGERSGPESLSPSLLFDVNIVANESITFNSRTVQATLSTELRLAGSDISPELTGLIDVKKGKFLYKRDFIIRRGLINFDDPIKPDPSLDIAAQSEVSGYNVTISILGKASEPIIDFTVDPPTRTDGSPISKLDIITLLSRGSLPDVAVGGTSAAENTAAAEALNLLAGQVEDTVQRVFDLSGQNIIRQVYIDTYVSPEGPIARFNLPLSITDNLDLILKVDQTTVKLSSEYSLHDSISLTGGIESSSEDEVNGAKRQGNTADTGVDVKFKFAFP